jgi:hypothetical protein
MKVCSVNIGMPDKECYNVLLEIKILKASSVAAKAKEFINISLDEDNMQLSG